jgi:hypothetical protein
MIDEESRLRREVQALRAEVKRLKYGVELGLAVIGITLAVLYPELLRLAIFVGVVILLALLISPVRRLIFSSWFGKAGGAKREF